MDCEKVTEKRREVEGRRGNNIARRGSEKDKAGKTGKRREA